MASFWDLLDAATGRLGIPQGNVANAQGQTIFPVNPLERFLSNSAGPTNQFAAAFMGPGKSPMPKLLKVRGPIASEPGYVYHATSAERAAEIADSGSLGTNKPSAFTDQEAWPDGSVERRNYFTPTAENTWQFAPEDGTPVLLRAKTDSHPFKRESTGDVYSTKPVPANNLEALTEQGWIPLSGIK